MTAITQTHYAPLGASRSYFVVNSFLEWCAINHHKPLETKIREAQRIFEQGERTLRQQTSPEKATRTAARICAHLDELTSDGYKHANLFGDWYDAIIKHSPNFEVAPTE